MISYSLSFSSNAEREERRGGGSEGSGRSLVRLASDAAWGGFLDDYLRGVLDEVMKGVECFRIMVRQSRLF